MENKIKAQQGRVGVAIAGNILTDLVKIIDGYPQKGMLSNIHSVSRAVGGCVPNTAINLARIDRDIPISAIGRVGDDAEGSYVIDCMRKHGINTDGVIVTEGEYTSFSDVMSIRTTGERTFFHYRGANTKFSPNDVNIGGLNCKMLHIGYILLLDLFDAPDDTYKTAMARFLKCAREAGISTSIDVVSDNNGNFAEKVIPALKFTDNAIMNEIECCGITGLEARDNEGALLIDNVRHSMQAAMEYGVGKRIIVHCPEASFCLNSFGEWTAVASLELPDGYVKGSVGAGDAFCAGCLYGIYHGLCDRAILEFASAAAAANLSQADSVSGMISKEEIHSMCESFRRKTLSF